MKRILVIGGGSIGERHVRCFQKTERADVALCDIRDNLRSEIVRRYDLSQAFSSLDEALPQNFDAAVVCTPAHLHIPMAFSIARHDTALLIEKPLSISDAGIDELLMETSSRQLPVSVAYVLRHHPALQALKRSVDSGKFGRPVQIVYFGGQHFPFYRPAYRDIYYTKHETGGGAIQDALTHVVNAAEWIVGPVTKLVADADHLVLEAVDVEDTVHLITRHAALMGTFSLNQHQPPNESTLTVICEHGAVRCEAQRNRWLSCEQPDAEWTVEEEFVLERDDMFVNQANDFLDLLDDQTKPACSLQEALQTLRVNMAALESARTGCWINL